jgi:hypothetical protein
MKASISLVVAELSVELAPAIESVANTIRETVGQPGAQKILADWAAGLGTIARIVADIANSVGKLGQYPLVWETLKVIATGGLSGITTGAGGLMPPVVADPFIEVKDAIDEIDNATEAAQATSQGWFDRLSQGAARYLEWSKQITEKLEDMQNAATRLKESLRTPFEVARDGFIELNNLLMYGFIDPETFARGGIRLREELEEALKAQRGLKDMGNTGGVAALQRGTSGSFSAVQAAGREFRDMAARQMEQTKLQSEANTLLRQIRDQEGITVTEATI